MNSSCGPTASAAIIVGERSIDTTAQHVFTTSQLVNGEHSFRALAAGHQHTCGIGTDNMVYCWGSDMSGQRGPGNLTGGLTTQPLALAPIPCVGR